MVAECLDDNIASEFVSGSLPRSTVTRVEGHLATCRDCRDLVAALVGDSDTEADSQGLTAPRELHTPVSGSGLLRPMRSWAVGDRVGRYVVLSALGAGGMGVVFAAYDPQLDRKIALKLLRTNTGINSKEARARLRREAQAIAQLSHPNVVNVYDVGATDDGDVYIAMEFVEGDTLTHWLRKFERTPREIVEVFLQAARGLAAAHAVGLLHRDFKPDNVLVGGDGRVRVTDFGLARSLLGPDEAARPVATPTALHVELTATGAVLGTPRYMPPEQLLGPDIDARSDQFSFCVALYEALYDQHPLPGATAVGMVDKGDRAFPPPEKKGVSQQLARAVVRGLEKERVKRHASMPALITELAPRLDRSPVRYAAFGLGAVIVAGVATAAVIARREPPQTQVPLEHNATQDLITRLNKLEDERKILLKRLLDGEATHKTEIKQLQVKLEEKTAEVTELVDKLTQVKGGFVQPPKPIKKVESQDAKVMAALDASEFDGCFAEWSERQAKTDADVTIRLTVTPEGKPFGATANYAESPSLAFCVEAAITRIPFPAGRESLDVGARVRYNSSDRSIDVTATIIGRRVPSQAADITP